MLASNPPSQNHKETETINGQVQYVVIGKDTWADVFYGYSVTYHASYS